MTSALSPWRPGFRLLESFRREMDDLFGRFFEETNGSSTALKTWAPSVDMSETDKEIVVKADLPGVDPKDVEISIVDNTLTLRGERKEAKEEKKQNFHRVERFAGSFYRAIPLPTGTDPEKVSAASSKGVITVTIPKSPGAQPKKIAVKAQD